MTFGASGKKLGFLSSIVVNGENRHRKSFAPYMGSPSSA